MKVWTDRSGKRITAKEFIERFKQGVQGISPMQQAKATYQSTWITVLGILLGIIATCFTIKTYWWLVIILVGSLAVTLISQIGNYQKYQALKEIEKLMNSNQEESNLQDEVKGGNNE